MRKSIVIIGTALVATLAGLPAQAAYCPAGYTVFTKSVGGNWSKSKPCCKTDSGGMAPAICVGPNAGQGGLGGGVSKGRCQTGNKAADAKCNQGRDLSKGGVKSSY